MLNNNTWNHFIVRKQMINIKQDYYCWKPLNCVQTSSGSFKNHFPYKQLVYK